MSPAKAPTPCMETLCPNMATRGGRCSSCRSEREVTRRGSARERGYDTRWERRRRRHLESEPWCRVCGIPGKDVDHVIPHRGEGWLFDLEGNLQTLCHRHHTAKTMHEATIPIGIMYPLDLPTPTRPTVLLCGPDIGYDAGQGQTIIDENLGLCYRDGRAEGIKLSGADALEWRNALLHEELRMESPYGGPHNLPLWLIVEAPRTAERAYWSHVMGTEAELLMPVLELLPPEWWAEYNRDHKAEEAMQRRMGG